MLDFNNNYKLSSGKFGTSLKYSKPINQLEEDEDWIITIKNGKVHITWEEFDKYLNQKLELIKKSSVFIWSDYFQFGSEDDYYAFNFKIDKYWKWLFNDDEATIMKLILNNPQSPNNFKKYWQEYIQEIKNHLNQKKYKEVFNKTIFILFDEPCQKQTENIKKLYNLAKQEVPGKEKFPGKLGVYLGSYNKDLVESIETSYNKNLVKSIDKMIWIVAKSSYDTMIEHRNHIYYKKEEEDRKRFWIYNDAIWGSFTCSAVNIRSTFWSAFINQIGGFLVSLIASWSIKEKEGEEEHMDPQGKLLKPQYILYHPGKKSKTDSTINPPHASLRLTLIRDGIEDYEYLKKFKEKLDKIIQYRNTRTLTKEQNEWLTEAEKLWEDIKNKIPEKKAIPQITLEELLRLRARIATQIEEYQKKNLNRF